MRRREVPFSRPFGRCAGQIVDANVRPMRTNQPVRSPWGIAFLGSALVLLLAGTAEISRLAVKVWGVDDAPAHVKVLLLLGAALVLSGGLCFMAVCLRSQVDGLLPRPRHAFYRSDRRG